MNLVNLVNLSELFVPPNNKDRIGLNLLNLKFDVGAHDRLLNRKGYCLASICRASRWIDCPIH